MTRMPVVAAPLAPTPHLLGAALAGLLCLAGCSNGDSPGTPGAAGDASHAGSGSGNIGGAESEGGTASVGGDTTTAGGSATGGDANAAGAAAGGVGSAGEAAAGGVPSAGGGGAAGAGGAAEEPPHITSSENVGIMTEEQFKALCDERGGTVEIMPHCGGFATAAGFSYDTSTQLLSEHTCAGANTCGGWNCIVPE